MVAVSAALCAGGSWTAAWARTSGERGWERGEGWGEEEEGGKEGGGGRAMVGVAAGSPRSELGPVCPAA